MIGKKVSLFTAIHSETPITGVVESIESEKGTRNRFYCLLLDDGTIHRIEINTVYEWYEWNQGKKATVIPINKEKLRLIK